MNKEILLQIKLMFQLVQEFIMVISEVMYFMALAVKIITARTVLNHSIAPTKLCKLGIGLISSASSEVILILYLNIWPQTP